MGRTPRIAKLVREFLPIEHTLSYLEAILRVYNLHGRRDNKYKARIKIPISQGVEAFTEAVEAEWAYLKDQTLDLNELDAVAAMFDTVSYDANAAEATGFETRRAQDAAFAKWLEHNTQAQAPGLPHRHRLVKPMVNLQTWRPNNSTASPR